MVLEKGVVGGSRRSDSRRTVSFGLLLAGMAALVVAVAVSTDRSASDGGVDDLAFSSPDGTTASLADFDGQPLVVNFFASWCPPCRAELPELEAFHVASENKVSLIGISHDLDRSSWRSLVEATDVSFPTYHQPNQEIFVHLELFVMPTTVLVDAQGEIVHTYSGVLTAMALRDLVVEHLGVAISLPEEP